MIYQAIYSGTYKAQLNQGGKCIDLVTLEPCKAYV